MCMKLSAPSLFGLYSLVMYQSRAFPTAAVHVLQKKKKVAPPLPPRGKKVGSWTAKKTNLIRLLFFVFFVFNLQNSRPCK